MAYIPPSSDQLPIDDAQSNLCCFCEWNLSAIFWAISGALPPARLLMRRLTWTLSFMASFTIFAVSSIISGSSMPGTILSKRRHSGPKVRSNIRIRFECFLPYAPCAMRLFLSCPIHPAYRSLAIPIRMFASRSRNRRLFGLLPGVLAIKGFYKG
jgi:hypothetical protein